MCVFGAKIKLWPEPAKQLREDIVVGWSAVPDLIVHLGCPDDA
jgi:hypothetical protein